MIKFYLLAFYALTTTVGFCKLYRINNTMETSNAQSVYKSVKEAHDDQTVLPGDTLMIEGSVITHPDITLSKRLVLIGPGYMLNENPQTQANIAQAIMSRITIEGTAAGTVLLGLTFTTSFSGSAPYISANNVIIMRCYMPNNLVLAGQDLQNIQILQNYFETAGVVVSTSSSKFSDVALKNNVITASVNLATSVSVPRVFSSVENNIFLFGVTLAAETFRNNVLASNSSGTVAIACGNIQYNLFRNAANVPAGTGNQTFTDSNLFVGASNTSADGQYKIKADSPLKAAGANGTEPGIFGGSRPYVLSGIPPLPTIYQIEADGVASKQSGLPIRIKVRANQ